MLDWTHLALLAGVLVIIAQNWRQAQRLRVVEYTMATKEEFESEFARIAAKIDELKAKIGAGGMSAEDEAAVLDELKALGADPAPTA